jgi:hypothetical protein
LPLEHSNTDLLLSSAGHPTLQRQVAVIPSSAMVKRQPRALFIKVENPRTLQSIELPHSFGRVKNV